MSGSENISKWKAQAEVDYFSLFVPLWLSFNSWFRDKFNSEKSDRHKIDAIKSSFTSKVFYKFQSYYVSDKNEPLKAKILKSHLGELNKALENSKLKYEGTENKLTFRNILIDRDKSGNKANDSYSDITRYINQKKKFLIYDGLYFTDHTETVFKAVIEVLYQVRCALFHGDLVPNQDNFRVVKYCYLILFDLMEEV